jgi:tetratricopeptide (TPR) repeat protein
MALFSACIDSAPSASARRVYGAGDSASARTAYPLRAATLKQAKQASDAAREAAIAEQAAGDAAAALEQMRGRGNAALSAGRWLEASDALSKVAAQDAGELLGRNLQFATTMAEAERLTNLRSFDRAAELFNDAIKLGTDQASVARERLDAVELRDYQIVVSSMLVSPQSPTGQPWLPVKDRSLLSAILAYGISYLSSGAIDLGTAFTAVSSISSALPQESTPRVQLEFTLPDGRTIRTQQQRSLLAVPTTPIVVRANKLATESIVVRLVVEGTAVATQQFNLGELLIQGRASTAGEGAATEAPDKREALLLLELQASMAAPSPAYPKPATPRKVIDSAVATR